MKKAEIYFNGEIVCSVAFDKSENTEHSTFLNVGYGDEKRTVAIVPKNHLIIIKPKP